MPRVSRHGRSRRRPRIDAEWCPLGHILKCSARSTRQIRRRPAAPQATRDRIRANADNWKASRRSLYSNAQVSNRSQRRVAGNAQGEDEAAVLLIDMYRTPVSGVLRRKESGFAVCGENPASISRFAAKTRPAFRSLWRESGAADPSARSKRSPDEPKARSRASSTRYGDIRVLPWTSHFIQLLSAPVH